ncbi:hypothetical protein L596_022322 [Steinernema carpocapsae]|uniref:Uncharacterized protein n=1 Tax=Steinernema carpocapsae TaxID=34508 RepID=A0A4U5MLE5_STECR|nr:hypothetical protein L596_022322 [Steinernema carpocapsae]
MRPSGKASTEAAQAPPEHLLAGNVEDPSRKSPSPDRNPARRATRRHHQPEALQRSTGRNLQGAEMGRPRPEHQRKKDLQSALRRRHRPDRGHGRRTPADGDRVARSIAKERPQDQPTEDQGDGGRRNQHPSRRFEEIRARKSVAGSAADGTPSGNAMEAAALQPMHPAGAAVRMRILGLDSSIKQQERSSQSPNDEWREGWQGSGSSTIAATTGSAASRRSRTSPKQRQEENGPRWPTPAPTSGPHALKHGGRRQHDPKEDPQRDGPMISSRNLAPRTGKEAHDEKPIQHGVIGV